MAQVQQISPKQVKGLQQSLEHLDSLAPIKHIGENLILDETGTLSGTGGGGDVGGVALDVDRYNLGKQLFADYQIASVIPADAEPAVVTESDCYGIGENSDFMIWENDMPVGTQFHMEQWDVPEEAPELANLILIYKGGDIRSASSYTTNIVKIPDGRDLASLTTRSFNMRSRNSETGMEYGDIRLTLASEPTTVTAPNYYGVQLQLLDEVAKLFVDSVQVGEDVALEPRMWYRLESDVILLRHERTYAGQWTNWYDRFTYENAVRYSMIGVRSEDVPVSSFDGYGVPHEQVFTSLQSIQEYYNQFVDLLRVFGLHLSVYLLGTSTLTESLSLQAQVATPIYLLGTFAFQAKKPNLSVSFNNVVFQYGLYLTSSDSEYVSLSLNRCVIYRDMSLTHCATVSLNQCQLEIQSILYTGSEWSHTGTGNDVTITNCFGVPVTLFLNKSKGVTIYNSNITDIYLDSALSGIVCIGSNQFLRVHAPGANPAAEDNGEVSLVLGGDNYTFSSSMELFISTPSKATTYKIYNGYDKLVDDTDMAWEHPLVSLNIIKRNTGTSWSSVYEPNIVLWCGGQTRRGIGYIDTRVTCLKSDFDDDHFTMDSTSEHYILDRGDDSNIDLTNWTDQIQVGVNNTVSRYQSDGYEVIGSNNTINWTGFGTAVIGTKNTLNDASHSSVVIGTQNTTSGEAAIAIGRNNIATSTTENNSIRQAIAIGIVAKAQAGLALAIGQQANAAAQKTVALGYFATVNHQQSIAIGNNASTTREQEVSFGDQTNTSSAKDRFLANVRAGELDTDAVNLKQMRDYVDEKLGDIKKILDAIDIGDGGTGEGSTLDLTELKDRLEALNTGAGV
ncbi:MAG: hypothetical protein NC218_03830 [Acetobacter sp.]|nr:hypothetical protein [Acetobacter sp.]